MAFKVPKGPRVLLWMAEYKLQIVDAVILEPENSSEREECLLGSGRKR